ncbi:MAG: ribonuclease P protein component [Acidobacteria bacterium]|nr:MAG: ribonuclease P protein component [Acidobacteriota bacterium]
MPKADAYSFGAGHNRQTPEEGAQPNFCLVQTSRPGRLRLKADIDRVVRSGARLKGNHLQVAALETGDTPPLMALAVGRMAGGAVVRNRIKRRLRAAAAECELAEGFAYVVWGDSEVERMDYWELLEALQSLTRRAAKKAEKTKSPGHH